jgi:hypothetical protein
MLYNRSHSIDKTVIGWASNYDGGNKKWIQSFGRETSWKTDKEMGG